MEKLTPAQLGHRAAAQGETVESCPFDSRHALESFDAWQAAYYTVEVRRTNGKDPNDHEPPQPHLCLRAPKAVCNCCHTCAQECKAEGALTATAAIDYTRVLWALPRIASALEQKNRDASDRTCTTCGCTSALAGAVCSVCGSPP